jgi:immunoglobulin-like protein involved in spore germination
MHKHFWRRPHAGWVLPILAASALACSVFGGSPATPTPTAFVPPTLPATDTDLPGPTATASTTTEPSATVAPVATDTPLPAGPTDTPLPPDIPEAILIIQPGIAAAVTSPVHVTGEADPTFEQNLVVQITDQFGGVLVTTPTTILVEAGQRGPYAVDVSFSVAADQPGRISVYSTSARDGGLIHLASVEVNLLASGPASPAAAATHPESLIINGPALNAAVSGGVIHLEGYSQYVFENQLAVVLCGEGGQGDPEPVCGTTDNVLEIGFASVSSPDVGLPGPYAGDLPYGIAAPIQARLVVYSVSPRDGGILHLATTPIQLNP